jgi:hypothetical protein
MKENNYTLISVTGPFHRPLRPLGPNMECLASVSSFAQKHQKKIKKDQRHDYLSI